MAIGKDRVAVVLFLGMAALVISLIITTVARLHSSDIQVPVRFTAYGENNIYRDHWYVQLSYVGFGLLTLFFNGFLVTKLYQLDRILSLGFMAASMLLLVVAVVIANAMFNLAPVL